MSEELRHYCRGGGGGGPARRARECGAQHRRAPGGRGRAQNVPGGDERDSNPAARGPTRPLTVWRPPSGWPGRRETALGTAGPSPPAVLSAKGHAEDQTDSNSTGRRPACAPTW